MVYVSEETPKDLLGNSTGVEVELGEIFGQWEKVKKPRKDHWILYIHNVELLEVEKGGGGTVEALGPQGHCWD